MRPSMNPAGSIAILILLGAALRWPTLSSPLAGDEALSYSRYSGLSWYELLVVYRDPNQHSLFSLLSNVSMALLGENEIAFRFPSLIAGIAGPVALYYLGRRLYESHAVAFSGALLCVLSSPFIEYSQSGRGYALTMCLAPVFLLLCLKEFIFYSKDTLKFLTVGISLVLILPSNVLFLFGAGVWFAVKNRAFFADWRSPANSSFHSMLWAWVVLIALTGLYFYCIHKGLLQGAKRYSSDPLDFSLWYEVAERMVQPWGMYLYAFIPFAFLQYRKQSLLFALIFISPFALSVLTGIAGYPRTYLFWLPFLLSLVGAGGVFLIEWLKRINQSASIIIASGILLFILTPVFKFLPIHYAERDGVAVGTIASSKAMASFVRKEVSSEALIVIVSSAPQGGLIGTELKEKVERNMHHVSAGNAPVEIYFVGQRNAMPDVMPVSEYYKDRSIRLPANSLELVKEEGNLTLFRLNADIKRFIPVQFEADNRSDLTKFQTPEISMKRTTSIKAFGQDALHFTKKGGESMLLEWHKKVEVDIKKEGAFLLQVYARKYGQQSRMLLSEMPIREWPPESGYLNPYFGAFRVAGKEELWQRVMALTKVPAGRNAFRPVFHLYEKESYFDAWQTFFISPE